MRRTAKERVDRGIRWLDGSPKVPGNWRSLLDPTTFRFANPDKSPLGQLFNNDYARALYELRITMGGDSLGFRSEYNKHGDCEALRASWMHALRTDKTWSVKTDYKYRYIKGVRYQIVKQKDGRVSVWEFKPGRAVPFFNSYSNYDSAMRCVRKLILTNKI